MTALNTARPTNIQDGVYNAAAVTKSDSVDIPEGATRALLLSTAGVLKVTFAGGTTVTLPSLSAGVWHPMQVTRVWSTGSDSITVYAGY
jgi:hypothetical protein